jgi:histone deacetylase 1/2
VVKPTTVRLVLSLAVSRGWPLRQIDIQNAFLYGHLHEDVYMAQPPDFAHSQFPNHVCKLEKSLYGLCQAPRAWFSHLTDKLKSIGFLGSQADHSLFVYHHNSILIYFLIYINDIIITGSDIGSINRVITLLQGDFAVKDMGKLSFFLNIEAIRTDDGLYLSQRRYILDLLMRSKMDKAKPCLTPMSTSLPLSKFAGITFHDPSLYESIVRGLQYLSFTRPDIVFAIHKVSKFMDNPMEMHWAAVKRILRYLKHTISHSLLIQPTANVTLQTFSDADWASDPDDRRSVGAYCVYLGNNLVSWSCKQQQTVARSSTGSEYKALANAAAELQWIKSVLNELGVPSVHSPILWCDNIRATYLTSNPIFHARTKHIEIDFHYVRDQVVRGQLIVRFISSKDQYTDALTKPLPSVRFHTLRDNLRVRSLPFRLQGRVEEQVKEKEHAATTTKSART